MGWISMLDLWMINGYAGIPEAYKILRPLPIDITDQCCNIAKAGCKGNNGKNGYSIQGTNSQRKDTITRLSG
jgi:hypothetical protein